MPNNLMEDAKKSCEKIADIDVQNTHGLASLIQNIMLDNFSQVRRQAQQSFICALVTAIVGIGFFIYAAWYCMETHQTSIMAIITGSLIQAISAINFFLYAKASKQFSSFHIYLDRTNRYLLANSICEHISETERDKTRKMLIETIANASVLTIDIVNSEMEHNDKIDSSKEILKTKVLN